MAVRRPRRSYLDTLRANDAAQRGLAIMAGKPPNPAWMNDVAPKRERAAPQGTPDRPLEKAVLSDVLKVLRHDPRVWICDRRQSGVFQDGDRFIRVGKPGLLDISGMLVGGKYFEIESKRAGEKPDERQLQRIQLVRTGGGISGYCWSAESALALLPS